jgi:glycosyltransferase involved in cell wall biosynthesis
MRIGIDIRLIGKNRTGDEAVFFNLVKNLAETDNNNQYFLFTDRDPKKDQDLKTEIGKLNLKNNFKVIFINSPNRFWWNLWALPHYLKKNPVDIFHTQYIAPFWLPKNVKLVLTIHDISFNYFPQFVKYSDLFFLKTLIPRSLKMAAKVIAVSEFTKKEIEKYYHISSKKVVAIYNGVDFELFNKNITQIELEEIRKKYDLPEKFLLYIGTLQPRKNIPVAIEALKDLDMPLVIAGNRNAHNFDKKIDATIEKLNLQECVLFPGWIDEEDKPALYKLAQCFVFPSLYEGFGITIIEAMATGIPVISSTASCLPEVGGDGAFFADPKNPQEFAKNISKAMTDESLRNSLVEKGIEVARKYTWRKNAEKTLAAYDSVMN